MDDPSPVRAISIPRRLAQRPPNRMVLLRKTEALVQLCRRLGLLVNEKKSELVPSQPIVFLGERLDLVAGKAFPTQERADGIRFTIRRILADGEVPFQNAESLLGTLVATSPTVPLGRLNLRQSREVELSIHPHFVGKTHLTSKGPGSFISVSLKALQEADGQDLLLCPVRTLEAYLDRSKHYRSPGQHKLIIPYRRGSVKDLSKQTLSNYIRETVVLAYQEQNPDSESVRSLKIKPHSIRHVATSLNALRAVDMDEVLQAGTWASPNVFLKHYVQYFSTDHLSQLSRLGGFVAAGSVM